MRFTSELLEAMIEESQNEIDASESGSLEEARAQALQGLAQVALEIRKLADDAQVTDAKFRRLVIDALGIA